MTMITVDLSKLGPVEFDTLQAQIEDAYSAALGRVESAADSLHRANGERGQAKRWGTEWRNLIDETITQVEADPTRAARGRTGVTAGDELKAYRAAVAACDSVAGDLTAMFSEYDSRPWPRYMITTGSDAHIHKDTRCSTCNRGRERTRFGWLLELSGKPVGECIDQFKATMCTVCFPDAPVVTVVDPNVCPGATAPGTRKVDTSGGRYSTVVRYVGDCTCGATGIRIKQDGTPAKHKPTTPVEAPAPVKVLAADSAPKRDEVTVRIPDADDAQDGPVVVAPTFGPLDEVEHVDQPGVAWVVERATNAGRLIVRASGALGVTTRVLAVKCRLLQSAADATATMTRDELVNELVDLAAPAAAGSAPAETRAALARFRTTVEVRHGFTSKGGGHVFDRSGYSPCQGWGELARMITSDRVQAVRIAADTARAVGAVHLRQFVGGVWCGDEAPAQATDERRLATCRACESAIAFEQLMRGARQAFEAGRPVVDADGEPVELGALVDSVELRVFFLGRVRGACGHYMAASERRAGLTGCERCPEGDDDDDQGDDGSGPGPGSPEGAPEAAGVVDGPSFAELLCKVSQAGIKAGELAADEATRVLGELADGLERLAGHQREAAAAGVATPELGHADPGDVDQAVRTIRGLAEILDGQTSDDELDARLAAADADVADAMRRRDDDDAAVVAGAVGRQDDQVLTEVMQAAGEPVGEYAQEAAVPVQRLAREARTGEHRVVVAGRVVETAESVREELRWLLRAHGFVSGRRPGVGVGTPALMHGCGVTVEVDQDGTRIGYPGSDGERFGVVRLGFGHDYRNVRDVVVGLVLVVEAARAAGPVAPYETDDAGDELVIHAGRGDNGHGVPLATLAGSLRFEGYDGEEWILESGYGRWAGGYDDLAAAKERAVQLLAARPARWVHHVGRVGEWWMPVYA